MAVVEPVGTAIDSAAAWTELMTGFPPCSPSWWPRRCCHVEHRPPQDQRGIYLFSDAGEDLCVGRTGITARSPTKAGRQSRAFDTGSTSTLSQGGLRAHRHSLIASCSDAPLSSSSRCLAIGGLIERRSSQRAARGFLALLTSRQIRALAGIGLSLANLLSQRLGMHAQVRGDMRDRPAALKRQPDPMVHQLIGVLLRSCHGSGDRLPPGQHPGLKASAKPGTAPLASVHLSCVGRKHVRRIRTG